MWKMLILLILILTNVLLQAQNESKKLNGIDAYIKKALITFEVPGASVAVVKNGKVILTKGFDTKKLGKTEPVDSKTLFGIASNTKAFTATALALLVEKGKVEQARMKPFSPEVDFSFNFQDLLLIPILKN